LYIFVSECDQSALTVAFALATMSHTYLLLTHWLLQNCTDTVILF